MDIFKLIEQNTNNMVTSHAQNMFSLNVYNKSVRVSVRDRLNTNIWSCVCDSALQIPNSTVQLATNANVHYRKKDG